MWGPQAPTQCYNEIDNEFIKIFKYSTKITRNFNWFKNYNDFFKPLFGWDLYHYKHFAFHGSLGQIYVLSLFIGIEDYLE